MNAYRVILTRARRRMVIYGKVVTKTTLAKVNFIIVPTTISNV